METSVIIALISALVAGVGVALINQLFSYANNRKQHEEQREDYHEDRQDEIVNTLSAITGKLQELEDSFSQSISDLSYEVKEIEMKQARNRILRFNFEVLSNVKHTKEMWDQVIDEIDVYNAFSEANPGFKNGKARHAIAYLSKTYDHLCEKGEFLQEEYIIPNTGNYRVNDLSKE